jgi:ATP-dependent Clp protease ATP-binding subunit ClpB
VRALSQFDGADVSAAKRDVMEAVRGHFRPTRTWTRRSSDRLAREEAVVLSQPNGASEKRLASRNIHLDLDDVEMAR